MLDLSKDFEDIFNDIDGFFVIDMDERIVYMCDNLAQQLNRKPAEAIGASIRDVIPTNTAYKILQTGKKQIGEMYFVEGYTIVSNGYPIYKGGELVGAFEYDVFGNIGFVEEFLDRVDNVGDVRSIVRKKKDNQKAKYSIENIKGSGHGIQSLKAQITAAARSNSTVLITGETGCGKELVAHAVHKLSQRSLFHFVKVNCAAIPAELFESELFGYEEGSFTGAQKGGRYGKAEIANNGTLFLDEIDNLSLSMQAKILRFLQEKEVLRVGGDFAVAVDTRIIAATNQDLKSLVEQQIMRKDLYYRLNVIEIIVPPLRERKEDIPEIAEGIVTDLNQYMGRTANLVTGIDNEALEALMDYDWPGNVRELRNLVERAMNRCEGGMLKLSHFDRFISEHEGQDSESAAFYSGKTLHQVKEEAEQSAMEIALRACGNNYTKAAAALGISRQMLHRKMRQQREKECKPKVTTWGRT